MLAPPLKPSALDHATRSVQLKLYAIILPIGLSAFSYALIAPVPDGGWHLGNLPAAGAALLVMSLATWATWRWRLQLAGWLLLSGMLPPTFTTMISVPPGSVLVLTLMLLSFLMVMPENVLPRPPRRVPWVLLASALYLSSALLRLYLRGYTSLVSYPQSLIFVLGVPPLMFAGIRVMAQRMHLQAKVALDERQRAFEALEASHRELEAHRDALTHALESARQASDAKSQFLANISHELRTPLNAIIGYTDLILEDETLHDAPVAEVTPDLERVRGAADHLKLLIEDVLDLSRIETNQLTLRDSTFTLSALFDELRERAQPTAQLNHNTLHIEAPPAITLQLDRARLGQILMNLLTNAAKFTHHGQITLRAVERDDTLCLDVQDTGIGISAEDQQRIFERFTQADGTSTRAHGGVGLGLAISQELAARLGLSLSVQSAPGQGATFTLTLPDAARAPHATPSEVGAHQ